MRSNHRHSNIAIAGGGINGLCTAWILAQKGHQVTVYERDTIMNATSCASSKLLHGGLRYLENREFRLVREALRERDAWIRRVPELAKPLPLTLPVYRQSSRPRWVIGLGLFLYDHLAGKSILPKSRQLTAKEIIERDPSLNQEGLVGGYEFYDGQMDDYALGLWVADRCKGVGVDIQERTEVIKVTANGEVVTEKSTHKHDRVINIAGPWATKLLQQSEITTPYQLDLVRGSHLILKQPCNHGYLLEVPNEKRIFFVLPWKGKTLVGTTEVRQQLNEPIQCSDEEQSYLLNAYQHYFPDSHPHIDQTFAGVRPLLYSNKDPRKATREYCIHRDRNLITVLGGKWTTALELAKQVTNIIH